MNHRLNSPGVIISNFAMPDTMKDTINDYYEMVSQYLFFKKYPSEDFEINKHGIINEKYKELLAKVRENFKITY